MGQNNIPKPENDSASKIWWEAKFWKSKAMGCTGALNRINRLDQYRHQSPHGWTNECIVGKHCETVQGPTPSERRYQLACRYVIHGGLPMLLPWHRNGVAMSFQFISLADDGNWQMYGISIMVYLKYTLPVSLGSVSTERDVIGQDFICGVN